MKKKLIMSLLVVLAMIAVVVLIAAVRTNVENTPSEAMVQTTDETVPEYTEAVTTEVETTSETVLTHEEQFAIIAEEITSSFKSIEYTPDLDEDALNAVIADLQEYKTNLQNNYLDYSPEFLAEIGELVSSHILDVDEVLTAYLADLEYVMYWNQKTAEYPVATYIWLFMKEQGWNDYVCAGIMGNMMVESGGHSLNIDPYNWDDATGRSFYGICQWGHYYKEIHNCDLDTQLNYLVSTIEGEFDYAGFCYYSGFTYGDFLNMTNCRDVALAFAKVYERCGSSSYSARQYCAQLAYSYFVG